MPVQGGWDGKVLWESSIMKNEYKKNAAPERFKIDVSNVKTLELVTINLGKWSAHSIRLRPELGGNVTAQDTSPAVTDVVPQLETLGAPYNKTQAKIREDAKARLNRP